MWYLLLYFLIPILIVCGLLYANAKKKWFTQSDANDVDIDQIMIAGLCFCFWPVVLAFIGFIAALRYLKNHALPTD